MATLECSSAGDKRFSAFYAKITLCGVYDSIENHYQLSKRWTDEPAPKTWRDAKGRLPDYFVVGTKVYDDVWKIKDFYYALWFRYLDENPDLVRFLRQYDHFTDRFATRGGVSQADAISAYLHGHDDDVGLFPLPIEAGAFD